MIAAAEKWRFSFAKKWGIMCLMFNNEIAHWKPLLGSRSNRVVKPAIRPTKKYGRTKKWIKLSKFDLEGYVKGHIDDEYYFVDASTLNNGKEGQKSYICVMDQWGELVCFQEVGDYTINQAEILAIHEALARAKGKCPILSDSLLAVNAVNGVWKIKNAGIKKLCDDISLLPEGCRIYWIERAINLAGHYLDKKFKG